MGAQFAQLNWNLMSDDIIRVCGEDGKGTTDLKQNSKGERISDMTCENEAKKSGVFSVSS